MDNKPSYEELIQKISELEEENENYKVVIENTVAAIIIIEEDTTISLANSQFETLSGITKQEVEGRMSLGQFFTEKEREKVIEYHVLRRMDMPLVPRAYETEFVDNVGNVTPVYMAVSMIKNTKRSVASILDLSDMKQTKEALHKQQAYFSQLFKNSPQAIMIVDAAGKILDVNDSFESILGYDPEKLIGQYGMQTVVPKELVTENEEMQKSALKGNFVRKETLRKHKDGYLVPVSVLGYPIKINNQIEGFFCIFDDISERKAFEDQLYHQAFFDSLTGLPNRILFMERLGRAVERSRRHKDYSYAVLLIDLDRFKDINDSLGHQAGDNLLIEISKRFQACIRSVDTVARLGGDEFAILTEDFQHSQEVIQIAKRIQAASELPFKFDSSETHISASIGIVANTNAYQDSESILRDADIAMYRAKAQGKACFRVFNKKMHELIVESRKTENELREAIKGKNIRLHYQPIISADTKKLIGFEALVRWMHPQRGIILPGKFIPVAEETGIILPLGNWIINEACKQMKEWQDNIPGCGHLSMNVNISVKQFMQKDIISCLNGALQENQLDPKCLKIELTESILVEPSKEVVDKFKQIRDIGIILVIDDFGTGYSSLSYLQQFPIDNLKIDRSFIKGMNVERESMEIVKTIVDLAKNLGLTVVAEGVENEEQYNKLKRLNCDNVQGYLFSKPVNKHSAVKLIKKFL